MSVESYERGRESAYEYVNEWLSDKHDEAQKELDELEKAYKKEALNDDEIRLIDSLVDDVRQILDRFERVE